MFFRAIRPKHRRTNGARPRTLHAVRSPLLRCLLLAFLPACARQPVTQSALTVVDDSGDTVSLGAPARQVVSLIPATTEILFAIGAGPFVVGRTRWCDYPEAAAAIPSVGDGINPSPEAVLARHPDLVIMYRSAANAQAASRIADLGIPVVRLSVDRLEDVPRIARLLGRLTGREPAADSLDQAFRTRLAAVTVPTPAHPSRVLILAWDQPPIAIGSGSFLSELVERAGGVNVFADLTAPSAPVSLEAIVSRDPDVLLSTSGDAPTIASRPEWRAVRAVRDHDFVTVNSSAFSRPSPRAPDAIMELAAKLRAVAP